MSYELKREHLPVSVTSPRNRREAGVVTTDSTDDSDGK